MGMIEDVVAVLSILLTFLGGVLIAVFNKKRAIPGFLLAAIFIIFSWYSFIYFAKGELFNQNFPYFIQIAKSSYLALAPLCFLYFKHVIFKKETISKKDYFHFIPSLIILSDLLFCYVFNESTNAALNNKALFSVLPKSSFTTFKTIQGLAYLVLIWAIDFRSAWKEAMKTLHSVKRSWLILFRATVTLLFILISYNAYHSYLSIEALGQVNPDMALRTILLTMTLLLFFYPSVIYRTAIAAPQNSVIKQNVVEEKEETENQAQILSKERLSTYIDQIEALNNDARFFKSVVTITDLADFLKISPRHLTYILNHHYQMRFSDFINGHRIRYIIRQFNTGFLKELTMEAIAFEAGFSSRSTFFAAFKKYTGKNPSQYLKGQLLQEN